MELGTSPTSSSSSFPSHQLQVRSNLNDLERGWRLSSFSTLTFQKEKIKLDICVTDPIRVDLSVFELWLEGFRGTTFELLMLFSERGYTKEEGRK